MGLRERACTSRPFSPLVSMPFSGAKTALMIGIGIPSSQSRMPLPKPMSLLLFFSAMVETVNSRKNNSYWRFQFHHEYPKSTANIEVGQLFTISSSGLESGLVN